MTPLVAVAHGSRDPRSAATVTELVELVRTLRPDLDARVAFLDLSAPRLGDVLTALHGQGHRDAVVVPLLLGRAFHARVDLPALVAEATRRLPRLAIEVAEVLGPDPRLEAAARSRLRSTGVDLDDPDLGVVLTATGSSHAPANEAIAATAARWAATSGCAGVSPAFASGAGPRVEDAVRTLRAAGARRIAVASWFLAPGLLPDRVACQARAMAPRARIAPPLGAHPLVARVLLDRFDEARSGIDGVRYA